MLCKNQNKYDLFVSQVENLKFSSFKKLQIYVMDDIFLHLSYVAFIMSLKYNSERNRIWHVAWFILHDEGHLWISTKFIHHINFHPMEEFNTSSQLFIWHSRDQMSTSLLSKPWSYFVWLFLKFWKIPYHLLMTWTLINHIY